MSAKLRWPPSPMLVVPLLVVILIVVAVLAACAAPASGRVVEATYRPQWTEVHPAGQQTCSGTGTSRVCSPGSPMWIETHPERWRLRLFNDATKDDGWRDVTRSDFETCRVGEQYPECLYSEGKAK